MFIRSTDDLAMGRRINFISGAFLSVFVFDPGFFVRIYFTSVMKYFYSSRLHCLKMYCELDGVIFSVGWKVFFYRS